jgi:hypothetical protein
MTQVYSDPKRASDPHALPDIEVFYAKEGEMANDEDGDDAEPSPAGWYWWACFPGCLPDGDAEGPFDTEAEATAAAQEGSDES